MEGTRRLAGPFCDFLLVKSHTSKNDRSAADSPFAIVSELDFRSAICVLKPPILLGWLDPQLAAFAFLY